MAGCNISCVILPNFNTFQGPHYLYYVLIDKLIEKLRIDISFLP